MKPICAILLSLVMLLAQSWVAAPLPPNTDAGGCADSCCPPDEVAHCSSRCCLKSASPSPARSDSLPPSSAASRFQLETPNVPSILWFLPAALPPASLLRQADEPAAVLADVPLFLRHAVLLI